MFFDTIVQNFIQETNEKERDNLRADECVKTIVFNYKKKADYLKENTYYKNKLSFDIVFFDNHQC